MTYEEHMPEETPKHGDILVWLLPGGPMLVQFRRVTFTNSTGRERWVVRWPSIANTAFSFCMASHAPENFRRATDEERATYKFRVAQRMLTEDA